MARVWGRRLILPTGSKGSPRRNEIFPLDLALLHSSVHDEARRYQWEDFLGEKMSDNGKVDYRDFTIPVGM